jgi:flagellar basal body rod protein FlgG
MSELTTGASASIAALTREFETITHNLANVSTVGYKRKSNAFSISLDPQESYSPGTVDLDSLFDFSQGQMVETGRPLDFALYGKLVPTGDSCYRMPDASIAPIEAERLVVKQKFQESSNVKIIEELVDMIFVTRLYQANMKSITAHGEASASLMSLAMG